MALRGHEKGIEILCHIDSDVPPYLMGDAGRLRQILTNLLGNALKFTHQGEIAIFVALEQEAASAASADQLTCKLRFSVRDTGIGIPKEKINLLFQQFTQVDASNTRQYGGTGLGLAISKQLAEMMGGSIGVESQIGVGSKFWFTAQLGIADSLVLSTNASPLDLSGLRALIIDDNATNCEILAKLLDSWQIHACAVHGGAAGLEALERCAAENTPFDLAIVDMQMPGMDGEEFCRRVKAQPLIAKTDLILLTSVVLPNNASRFLEMGFAGYVTKPVHKDDLLKTINQALGRIAHRQPDTLAAPEKNQETLPDFSALHLRILLAEDNVTNQQVALGILKKMGVTAIAVTNGLEAVEALDATPFDLVLMDVQMPVMGGLEATMKIRKSCKIIENRAIPILAMTAHAMQSDKIKCLDVGMNDHISKPISATMLGDALQNWLNRMTDDTDSPSTTSNEVKPSDSISPLPIWDRDEMLNRMMHDEDLAQEIIDEFLSETPTLIDALKECLAEGNMVGIAREAHTIKGVAAAMSAEVLRDAALQLELAAKEEEIQPVMQAIHALAEKFADVETAMRSQSFRHPHKSVD